MAVGVLFVLIANLCVVFPVWAADPTKVTTQTLQELVVYPETRLAATAQPLNDSRLSAEVSAPVARIAVRVGDVVDAGALLVRLDAETFELTLQQEEARLRSLEARHALAEFQALRYADLAKQNAISDELRRQRDAEAASLKADIDAQRATVQQTRLMVDKCNVRAPFRAVIVDRLVGEGELASPGTPLVRLYDVEHMELVAKVQSADADALAAAPAVSFDAVRKQFPATLRTISEAYDPVERSREARFTFTGDKPLPGTAGIVIWKTAAPFVKPDLVVRRSAGLGVFVADAGVARFIPLPDAQEGRPAAVNLPANTHLIVDGRYTVQEGDELAIGP